MGSTVKLIAIAFSLSLVGGLSIMPNATGHTTSGNLGYYTSATQSVCFATYGLNLLNLDGSTGNGQHAKNQIKLGMYEVSDNTDMNISETTSCSGFKNWVTAFYSFDIEKAAKVSYKGTTLGNEWRMMEYNTNSLIKWKTNGNCHHTSLDLSYMANHEFGHFAGMGHQIGGSSHTMMGPKCSQSGYDAITAADIAHLNDQY